MTEFENLWIDVSLKTVLVILQDIITLQTIKYVINLHHLVIGNYNAF